MSRSIYINKEALTKSLKSSYPSFPDSLIQHTLQVLTDQALESWNIEQVGHPEFLFTDFTHAPEDADYIPHASALLQWGPSLFQIRKVSVDEVDGVEPSKHYLYRWALQFLSRRDALLFARHGLHPSISSTNRERIEQNYEHHRPLPRDLPTTSVHTPITGSSASRYRLVTQSTVAAYLADLRAATRLGFDTETYPVPGWEKCGGQTPATRPRWDRVAGISISSKVGTGWYIDAINPLPEALTATLQALADPNLPITGHNLRFDVAMVRHSFGVEVQNLAHDTMIQAWLLGHMDQHQGLKERAKHDLGINMIEFKEAVSGYDHMGQIPPERIAPYAGADADIPLQLSDLYLPKIQALGLMPSYELELSLMPLFHAMEWQGMYVDRDELQLLAEEFTEIVRVEREKLMYLAGKEFNPNSAPQLSKLIYDTLGYPKLDVKDRRAKGIHATDKVTLNKILMHKPHDPFLTTLMRFRQLDNLRGKVLKFPLFINPSTNRIHSSWNSTKTETTRMSNSSPNLMQIPTRTEYGARVRRAFKGQNGNHLLVADLSQIEPRLLAHQAQDPALMEVFTSKTDLYRFVGSQVYGIPPEQISKEQRNIMKTVTLATQYGGQAYTASMNTMDPLQDPPFQVAEQEMEQLITSYFTSFPGIPKWMQQKIQFTREHKYAVTEGGMMRRIPGIDHYDNSIRMGAERQAINHPIQGTAAEIMKRIAVNLYKNGIVPSALVHDEAVIEGSPAYLKAIYEHVIRLMETSYSISVPIVADGGIGDSWNSAKK